MIFLLSKRVFLNVVCPLTKKETLLNANYYIADCQIERIHDEDMSYNEDGQLEDHSSDRGYIRPSMFNITYGNGCLNPGPFITTFMTNGRKDAASINEVIVNTMSQYLNMIAIQEQIYLQQRRGNGLLFIIFYSEDNVWNFGGLISSFLAENFGEDVTFVDAKYHPQAKGQYEYIGNLANARKVGRELNDAQMMNEFLATVSHFADTEGAVENMMAHLQKFNVPDLIKLYGLLWPDDPLPQAYYTTAQLKEIIIGKMIEHPPLIESPADRFAAMQIYDPYGY